MVQTSTRIASYLGASLAVSIALALSASAQTSISTDPVFTASIPVQKPLPATAAERFPDVERLKAAHDAYRRGDVTGGDQISRSLADPNTRIAAEWSAIRTSGRSLGFQRVNAFREAAPDLPMQSWLQRRAEDALIIERARPATVLAFFADRRPVSVNGKAALATALLSVSKVAEAEALALVAYRDRALTRDVAVLLENAFPTLIGHNEQALRAQRLILLKHTQGGIAMAGKLGADEHKLALAVAHAFDRGTSMAVIDAVPVSQRHHSSFALAKAQVLRRLERSAEARDVLYSAPRDAALQAEPDEWWIERRMLARKLLDRGDAAGAYRIVGEALGLEGNRRAEAEFHAGWIALRFLNFAQTAAIHFEESARHAESPQSKSRAAYWLGRAIDVGAEGDVQAAYAGAARWGATYYGQMAAERLGAANLQLSVADASDADQTLFSESTAGQVIDRLLAAGLTELAIPLAIDHARIAKSASQIDALADRFVDRADASTVLAIGRNGVQRGLATDHHAFPVFGVPSYEALPGSAEKAMVYAIARQESAFQAKAVSHANARGLMQMLPSTAASTARRFGVAFDARRLTEDPAFCARLGAAHLGELLEETKGSIVMTFAAYNAGGHRVKEWIDAYGDPRQPGVDVVDWVERIPFSETRNYVQRVMENLQVYRARLSGDRTALVIGADLLRGRR